MTDEKDNNNQSLVDKLITALLRLPWADVLGDALKALRQAIRSRSYRGLYEVLEYESTLELKDRKGKKATFRKREKARYLQDNVIAYQDQAWGDGQILLNYRCTPGTPVDRYRSGHKTYILVSRREVKNKGDVDEFNIGWSIRQGFPRRTGYWETHVTHQTRHLRVNVVFPKSRPPRRATLIESNRQRTHNLAKRAQVLRDGRWLVTEAHKDYNGAQQGSPRPLEPNASAEPCEHTAS
jgi:hypothetical protein